jgi:hypothetical protein
LAGKPIRNADEIMRRVLSVLQEAELENEHEQSEKIGISVMRPKEQWLEKTGGLRFDETPSQFEARVAEINRLEGLLRSGNIMPDKIELILRRLCELKRIFFEDL